MTTPQSTIDLRQYWNILRSRRLAFGLPVVVLTGLAILFTLTRTPQYTAEARVRVDPLVAPFLSSTTAINASQPDMGTEAETAASSPVAILAGRAIGVTTGSDALLKHLHVQAASTSFILTFQYTSPSPRQAAQYANAFAQAYLTYRNSTVTVPLNRLITGRENAISQLEAQLKSAPPAQKQDIRPQLSDARAELAQFQSARELISGGALIENAEPPASPSSPSLFRNLAIGIIGGLLLGVSLALVREALDDRIKSREALEVLLGAPVIGVIPKVDKQAPEDAMLATVTDVRGPISEAYRVIATSLQYMAARNGQQVLMIASPLSGAGKTTTTANLGVVLAQAEGRVILVSADLRLPRLHTHFGLSNKFGLSSALVSRADVKTLLQKTAIPNLYVLVSGPEPYNPAAALASPILGDVLASLQSLGPDFIIVDTPALLSVADSLIIAPRMDGAVMLWNAEDSRASILRGAQEQLMKAGANVIAGIYSFDQRARIRYSGYYEGDRKYPSAEFPVPVSENGGPVGKARASLGFSGFEATPGRSAE